MNYSTSRRERSILVELLPWAALLVGGLMIFAGMLKLQTVLQDVVSSELVKAQVVAYEEHGYPVPTETWLRVELVEDGTRVALQVPNGIRPFRENQEIGVYRKSVYRGYWTHEYVLADPRQMGRPHWVRLGIGSALFFAGAVGLIRRAAKSRGHLRRSRPNIFHPMKLVPIPAQGDVELPRDSIPAAARSVLPMIQAVYGKHGFFPPWICYLAVENEQVVGTCGFKAPPQGGRTEVAYFTFAAYEGRGLGTRMAAALIDIAGNADPTVLVAAQTLPEANASTRILTKLGFRRMGEVMHPEDGLVWEWHLEQTERRAKETTPPNE